ncbi:MAG: hypothetical protein ACO245_06725, partial [Ilumatobacteraceae bacterium]
MKEEERRSAQEARVQREANRRAEVERRNAERKVREERNKELRRVKEEEQRLQREVQAAANAEERQRKKQELEEKRKERNRLREENAALRRQEQLERQQKNREARALAEKKRNMARRGGVNIGYVEAFMNATPNANFKAKVNADKRVARLYGIRPKYIEENRYDNALQEAQRFYKDKVDKQKLANLSFKGKVSTSYVKNYMNAMGQSIANVNQTAFLNKVRKDVKLNEVESRATGKGRVGVLVNRMRMQYVPAEEYNNRLMRAQAAKGGLNIERGLMKSANVGESYVRAYMNVIPIQNGENMNAYQKKFKAKANADRAIIAREGGLRRLGGVKYIPEAEYTQRKAALNKKNTGIPAAFVNAYLREKNQTMETLNKEGLKQKFAKSKELANLTNGQLRYETDNAKLDAALQDARNVNAIATNAKTSRDYVRKYVSNKQMTAAAFKNDAQKMDELKKLIELSRHGVTNAFRNAHLKALNKTSVTEINVQALKNKFNKTRQLGNIAMPYMSDENL